MNKVPGFKIGDFHPRPQAQASGKAGTQIDGNCCFRKIDLVCGGRGSGIGVEECGLGIFVVPMKN